MEDADRDADRLELLDRIAARIPDLDLDRQQIEWMTLDDGHEALLVNGGGIDGGGAPVRFRMLHVFDIRDDLISRRPDKSRAGLVRHRGSHSPARVSPARSRQPTGH